MVYDVAHTLEPRHPREQTKIGEERNVNCRDGVFIDDSSQFAVVVEYALAVVNRFDSDAVRSVTFLQLLGNFLREH